MPYQIYFFDSERDLPLLALDPSVLFYRYWLDQEAVTRVAEGDDGRLAGFVQALDSGKKEFHPWPGVCEFWLYVLPEHRGKGLGDQLFAEALKFARQREAKRLSIGFPLREGAQKGIAFLEKRGFKARGHPVAMSSVDLTTFDPARFAEPIAEIQRRFAIRFVTLAEVGGETEENLRRLYEIEQATRPDIPTNQGRWEQSFATWRENRKNVRNGADTTLLAIVGETWIGTTGIESHRYTGILSEWRGKNIATALKAAALTLAKARGMEQLQTHNHEDNAAMLAVNRKLGYVPEEVWMGYEKRIDD
jgi:GNAT superfamily N-acetyltransferase